VPADVDKYNAVVVASIRDVKPRTPMTVAFGFLVAPTPKGTADQVPVATVPLDGVNLYKPPFAVVTSDPA